MSKGGDLEGAAARAAAHVVKARARHYARRPAAMEALHPGLASAPPAVLAAVAAALAEGEAASPRRWFGFGGEVGLVNARAAALLGRTRRLAARRGAAQAISSPQAAGHGMIGPPEPPRA